MINLTKIKSYREFLLHAQPELVKETNYYSCYKFIKWDADTSAGFAILDKQYDNLFLKYWSKF